MKSLFVAIALVAVCSVVNAAEVKKDSKAPVVAGKTMTDTDMDKVTAGAGTGVQTAFGITDNVLHAKNAIDNIAGPASPRTPGFGTCTAGLTSGC